MAEAAATESTRFRPPARRERERPAPAYVIVDEPSRPLFPGLVVDPFAPLLATVCAGSLVGLAWMVLNGWAMSSPTRRRETAIAVAAIAALVALVAFAVIMLGTGLATERAAGLAILLLRGITLAAAYAVYRCHATSFRRHCEAGRRVAPAGRVVVAAMWFRVVAVAVSTNAGDWGGAMAVLGTL